MQSSFERGWSLWQADGIRCLDGPIRALRKREMVRSGRHRSVARSRTDPIEARDGRTNPGSFDTTLRGLRSHMECQVGLRGFQCELRLGCAYRHEWVRPLVVLL